MIKTKKMKILTIVGTRPEIIKLCRVIHELDKYTNHIMVHSGQNYDFELNEIFFQQLGIRKPDHFLNAAGSSVAQTIGNVIYNSDQVMAKENPDAMLILGDTNSCLSAISAKRRKIANSPKKGNLTTNIPPQIKSTSQLYHECLANSSRIERWWG